MSSSREILLNVLEHMAPLIEKASRPQAEKMFEVLDAYMRDAMKRADEEDRWVRKYKTKAFNYAVLLAFLSVGVLLFSIHKYGPPSFATVTSILVVAGLAQTLLWGNRVQREKNASSAVFEALTNKLQSAASKEDKTAD